MQLIFEISSVNCVAISSNWVLITTKIWDRLLKIVRPGTRLLSLYILQLIFFLQKTVVVSSNWVLVTTTIWDQLLKIVQQRSILGSREITNLKGLNFFSKKKAVAISSNWVLSTYCYQHLRSVAQNWEEAYFKALKLPI